MAGVTIKITPDPKDYRAVRDAFDRLAKVGRSPRRVLGRVGLFIRREAQRRLRERVRYWGPGKKMLGKSLAILLDEMSVTVGSNLIYAAIQQLGGTVEPHGHKYLAIPVLAHLQRAGLYPRDLPKGSMKFVRSAFIRVGTHSWQGPALVRVSDTEIEHSAQGAGKTKRRAGPVRRQGEVMFALIKRATIRGRPYLVFETGAKRFLVAELQRDYQRAAESKR